jgi:hypothetical protein
MQFEAFKQDACSNCDDTGWVNSEEYCQHCWKSRAPYVATEVLMCDNCINNKKTQFACPGCGEITDYIDSETSKCIDCSYGHDWKTVRTETLNVPNCKSCSRRALVDKHGVCKTCHINRRLDTHYHKKIITTCPRCSSHVDEKATKCLKCKTDIYKCSVCNKNYVKTWPHQDQCYLHLPACAGCKKPFSPPTISDVFCSECKSKVSDSKCVSCGKFTVYMSEAGKCKDCE